MTGKQQSEIPEWDELLDRRRAERAEALRFARAGLWVHDGEMVCAEDAGQIGQVQPHPEPVDEHLEYCGKFFSRKVAP